MEVDLKKMGDKLDLLKQQLNQAKEATEESRDNNLKRYQDSWMYYRSLLPMKGAHEFNSYVEPVLYEAVSNVKPSLLNVFTENEEQAVIFRPQNTNIHKSVVDAVNKRINDIFLRENEGKRIMGDVFTEGLVTGDTFIKFYVEEFPTEQDFEFEEWTPSSFVDMLVQMWPETDLSKLETKTEKVEGQQVVMLKGKLKLRRVDLEPTVEHVAQGDLFIDDSTSVNIADARYVGHRRVMTVGQALELGYPEDIIDDANTYDSYNDSAMSTRNLVIEKAMVGGEEETVNCADEAERKIVIWEHYIHSSLPSKDGKVALYQVIATDNDIITVTPVSRIPFVHGVPESVPGSFWGGSLFDRVQHLQDLLSIAERNRLQASINVAHPRWTGIKGKYDRQSVLNNRPGSLIEMTEPGAVGFLMQPQNDIGNISVSLNDLRGYKDRLISTSVGSIVGGGALNNAAASTVAMAMANEELKDKVIAKSFAWTLVKPLFELIYETLRDLDMDISVEDPNGQVQMLKGSALPPRPDFTIDVNTSNDDALKAMSLTNILTLLAQTSAMPIPLINEEKAYNLASDLCRLQGIDNPDDYFINPADKPEPTPEEMQAAQQKQQLEAALQQTQLDLQAAQVQLAAVQTLKVEREIEEMLKDGNMSRERTKEELRIKYEELALKRANAALDYDKYETQKEAMEADIALTAASGRGVDITVPR